MPPPLRHDLPELSSADLCRRKKARPIIRFRAVLRDAHSPTAFCGRFKGIEILPFSLKQLRCPGCGAAETLNCHSKLYGNDPDTVNGQAQRGQRVFCSPRGQRGGCGRTFSIFVAKILPGHSVTGLWLWTFLAGGLAGGSIRAQARKTGWPFPVATLYHVLQRLRRRLPEIRSRLSREQPAPASIQTDPLLQTVEHLRRVFPKSACPLADFQQHFQSPLLE